MTSQAKRSGLNTPCFRNGHIMWLLLFVLIDNNDEVIGGAIGGVLGAVGLLSLLAIIAIGIHKGWDNTNCICFHCFDTKLWTGYVTHVTTILALIYGTSQLLERKILII